MKDIYIRQDIKDSWLYAEYSLFSRWLDLLMLSWHEPTKILIEGMLISVPQGCVAIRLEELAKKWDIKKGNVSHFLSLLEEDELAKVSRRGKVTIINLESRYVRLHQDI